MINSKWSRRDFLKIASVHGAGLAGANALPTYAARADRKSTSNRVVTENVKTVLEDGSELNTPFRRIESGRDGPALLLTASLHGNEVIGAEVAMRLQDVCVRELRAGSVWLVPMANLLAVRSRRHSFGLGPEQSNRMHPTKVHNMQRFPGDPNGNNTQRAAFALDQTVIRHCSHLVDIHCYQRMNAAETLGVNGHERSRPMADATTTRFIRYVLPAATPEKNMLINQIVLKHGGCAVGMELSGQFEISERQVQIGLSSMVNIAKRLGMLPGEPERIEGPRVTMTKEKSHVAQAPDSGIFVPGVAKDKIRNLAAEDYVEKGQSLGHIIREKDLERVPILAPATGYLAVFGLCHWGQCDASLPAQHPYAEAGEAVATVVTT
ncbi:MAG: succinylglutamate desuccinylase/aspartoacylase family protein [Verrucomicrobia bacterium]|nr:succinylglutamate desuccinylase/aspartoacylase family protein [Verrucomicrobiota bacterium]